MPHSLQATPNESEGGQAPSGGIMTDSEALPTPAEWKQFKDEQANLRKMVMELQAKGGTR